MSPQKRYGGDCDDCKIILYENVGDATLDPIDVTALVTWGNAISLTAAFATAATAGLLL